ncbi:hypothetical protein PENTCL1PPCAC_6073, partial [Pristionchus entomophagus]
NIYRLSCYKIKEQTIIVVHLHQLIQRGSQMKGDYCRRDDLLDGSILFEGSECLGHGTIVEVMDVVDHLLMADLLGVGARVHAVIAVVEQLLKVSDVIGASLSPLGELVDAFLQRGSLVRHVSTL